MIDRVKGKLLELVRAAFQSLPPWGNGIDYLGLYRAKVVSQSADKLYVDVQADAEHVGGVPNVRLWLGLPGCTVEIQQGAYVRIGWLGGDPRFPYVEGFEQGETAVNLTLTVSSKVRLGGATGTEVAGLGQQIADYLAEIRSKFNAHTHVETGGTTNAVLLAQQVYPLPATPPDVRATKVEVK